MGCRCTDGIAEYNLANDSSPSHEGAAQVTREQPESARAQLNLRLFHHAALLLPLLPLLCCQRCPFPLPTAAAPLPLSLLSRCCCRCRCHAMSSTLPPPPLPPQHTFCCTGSGSPSHEGAASQRLQGRSSSHEGAAQVTRAQPKSQGRSPSAAVSVIVA